MGTLTLTQLEDEVRSALGGRTDLDSRLTRFINLAQERLARAHTFEEMQRAEDFTLGFTSTPATDKFQAFSTLTNSNPKEIYSVTIVDGTSSQKLIYRPPRQWDKLLPAPESRSTGRPAFYTTWNDKFEWYPVPDKAYSATIRMSIWPTDLSGSNKSDLDHKDDIIVYLAVSWAFHSLGRREDAARFYNIAKVMMEEAFSEDRDKPDGEFVPEHGDVSVKLTDYWKDPFITRQP